MTKKVLSHIHRLRDNSIRVGVFLAAGIPALTIAVALNWLFVEKGGWHKSLSYALVLFIQVTINFFICRIFVFSVNIEASLFRQYGAFMSGILIFRGADWVLYTLLVNLFGIHYLGIQLLNTLMLSILKYKFSKYVIEK